ncbi:NAD(P)-dependent oxidoreductase [bacterium]|nr:NAD(P)-dependent oxidoreductase [bacterium]
MPKKLEPLDEAGRRAGRLTREQILRNFEEIRPPLSTAEASFEAERCLYCEYDIPCMRGCPTKIDIPRFIKQIAQGRPLDAARTILSANIFGAVCARVCPVEKLCESLCVCSTVHGRPIPIGKLQRFATDRLMSSGELPFERGADTGRHIAIVGAGPAGVSAAFELSKLGHKVTIHEKEPAAGGLDRYGIAEYKIGNVFVQEELEFLLRIGGVKIKTNERAVDEIALRELLATHDAVLLGIGLGETRRLDIPGEDAAGVEDALSFIRRIKTQPLDTVEVGSRVIVIGAGNTAIDAATQARRLGAQDVIVAYRGDKSRIKCTEHEYELSVLDDCRWMWNVEPVEVLVEDGEVSGVRFREKDGDAMREFELPCDHFVKAIGQVPHPWIARVEGLALEPNGTVKVDPITWQTSVPKLYAAGDCVVKAKEVVNAVYEGKRAALSIDGALSYG